MDNLTHTLFGLTLARTPLGRAGRGATATLVIASNVPDVDILSTAGGGVSYLQWHRGPTHGPLGVVGLGLATAAAVWAVGRLWDRRAGRDGVDARAAPAPAFSTLAIVATLGVLFHVLMDFPTSYGTRLLSPFSWRWYAADVMPIVDVYLLIALAVGLAFGEISRTSRRRVAAIVLTLMAANYGLRVVAHRQALALAPRLFGPLPPPCNPQPRRSIVDAWPRDGESDVSAGTTCLVEIAAMPTFLSPFRWRVIADLSNGFELHDLDVLDAQFRRDATNGDVFWRRSARYPKQWMAATFTAAATRTGGVFLGFSRFPAVRTFTDPGGVTTVRWNDVRFVAGVWPGDVQRRADLFSALVRVGPDGRVIEERLGR